MYLAAIAIFCNEAKGKSALALSRDLCVSYKCAFVLLHKLREAMAEELRGRVVGGERKVAEVDSGYFGGYVKPANLHERRVDRRFVMNQSGKRKCVVVIRERDGNTIPAVFRSEGAALSFVRSRIAKGTQVHADESANWNDLHSRFEMKRINHQAGIQLRWRVHELGRRRFYWVLAAACCVISGGDEVLSPMPRNKNQHWVPQCYLKAWVDQATPPNYEGYVHIFDRYGGGHRRKSPANILAMPDLYTIFEGSKRDLRIEDTFSKWETDFVRVSHIIESEQFGTGDDAADLYAFAGAMIARPPHRIEFFQNQWDSIVKKARSIRIDPNVAPIRTLTEEPSMSLDEAQEFVDNPMGTWFPHDVVSNIEVLSRFFGCDVLVNVSEHPFLTSDAPAVVHHLPRNPRYRAMPRGLGSPGCEITLPISPRTALLFRHKAPGIHAFLSADWEKVFEVNFRTITQARERIISDRPDIYFVRAITERVAQIDSE